MKPDFTYHFAPVKGRYKSMRTEVLHSHSYITAEKKAHWPEAVEFERGIHRQAVGVKITEALYEGWFPESIEYYEGQPDYRYSQATFTQESSDIHSYHFYTKVHLLAPYQYPLMERNPQYLIGEDEPISPSMVTHHPKDLK